MKKIDGLFSQLAEAASEIKGQIAELDKRISLESTKRNALTSGRVSKEDFLQYVREDIRRKGDVFKVLIAPSVSKHAAHGFGTLDAIARTDAGLSINYSVDSIGAHFYFLGDQIFAGVARLVDALDWDNDAVAIVERKKLIEAIDGNIKEMNAQRDNLAENLLRAGVRG